MKESVYGSDNQPYTFGELGGGGPIRPYVDPSSSHWSAATFPDPHQPVFLPVAIVYYRHCSSVGFVSAACICDLRTFHTQ